VILVRWLNRRIEDHSKRMTRRGLDRFLEREFAALPVGARVLSVGAGGPINRRLARHAERVGFVVKSLDVDPARGPDFTVDLCADEALDVLGVEAFDAVVMAEVLEHIATPQRAIDRVAAVLRPGGRLILTTPFLFPQHNRPRDFYRYTRYGLEHLLAGFEGVIIEERAGWAESLLALPSRLYKEPGTAPKLAAAVVVVVGRPLMPIARLLTPLAPRDFLTIGYVATARRPAAPDPA